MVDVSSASAFELETIREAVNRELRHRAVSIGPAFEKSGRPPGDSPVGATTAGCETNSGQSRRHEPGLTLENVEDAFRYHAWHPGQAELGNVVREALVAAAKAILRVVPTGPDRDAALRKLREARMDANSAITHNGRF